MKKPMERRPWKRKTVSITITIPYELLDDISEFMGVFQIYSRSFAISWLINQGLVRMKERAYDKFHEALPEKYPKIEEEKPKKKKK